jgi:hypothetical protein
LCYGAARHGEVYMQDTDRLRKLREMNPEFAEAEARGERWAVQHADMVRGIDGEASRRHPERAPKEDGQPHNFCGVCPHPEGCMMCDLDDDPSFRKWAGAAYRTN